MLLSKKEILLFQRLCLQAFVGLSVVGQDGGHLFLVGKEAFVSLFVLHCQLTTALEHIHQFFDGALTHLQGMVFGFFLKSGDSDGGCLHRGLFIHNLGAGEEDLHEDDII